VVRSTGGAGPPAERGIATDWRRGACARALASPASVTEANASRDQEDGNHGKQEKGEHGNTNTPAAPVHTIFLLGGAAFPGAVADADMRSSCGGDTSGI